MQISSVLVHSLDAAEYSKRCSRSRAFTQDQSNPKALRAGGFASGEKRLGVQATLTHCRPLEAHLSRAVGQQGAKAKFRFVCNLETGYRCPAASGSV